MSSYTYHSGLDSIQRGDMISVLNDKGATAQIKEKRKSSSNRDILAGPHDRKNDLKKPEPISILNNGLETYGRNAVQQRQPTINNFLNNGLACHGRNTVEQRQPTPNDFYAKAGPYRNNGVFGFRDQASFQGNGNFSESPYWPPSSGLSHNINDLKPSAIEFNAAQRTDQPDLNTQRTDQPVLKRPKLQFHDPKNNTKTKNIESDEEYVESKAHKYSDFISGLLGNVFKINKLNKDEFEVNKSWKSENGSDLELCKGLAKLKIKNSTIEVDWHNLKYDPLKIEEVITSPLFIKISEPMSDLKGTFVQIRKRRSTWYLLVKSNVDLMQVFSDSGFKAAGKMNDKLTSTCLNLVYGLTGSGSTSEPRRIPSIRSTRSTAKYTYADDTESRKPSPPLVPAPLTNNEYELLTRLFHYPPGEKFAIVVREQDAHRLNEGEYLNDTIIEFYLRYLRQNSEIVTFPSTYFYNTFFYNQMKRKDDKSSGGEFGYEKIKKWTKNVDIFNFEYLVVPICEAMHWYLAIIYNPGAALKEEEGVDKEMAETKVKNIHVKKISAISIDSDEVVSSSHEHKGLYRIGNEVDEIEEIEEDVIEFGSTGCEQKFEEMDSFESIDELTQSHVKGAKEESVLELASSPKINNLKVSQPVFVEEDSLLRLTEPELIEDDEKEFPNNLGNSINLLAESGENVQTPQPKEEDDSLMIIEELQELVTVQETSSKATKKVSVKSKGKSKERSKKYDGEKNNCNIIILDSLGIERPSTISKLKTYLVLEAKHRKGIVVNLKNIKGVYAKVPIQPNTCDCGVYLLHYVEIFFKDPIKLRDMILHRVGTKQDWFDIRDIPEKRKLIMGLINSYTTETGKAEKVICPTVSPMDVSDDDDLQIIEL